MIIKKYLNLNENNYMPYNMEWITILKINQNLFLNMKWKSQGDFTFFRDTADH